MKTRQQRNKEKDRLGQLNKLQRKEFFTNLKMVCNLYAGYDLYSKFPAKFLEELYTLRLRKINIVADNLDAKDLKWCCDELKYILSNTIVEFPDGKGQVPLDIQLTEGYSLALQSQHCTDDKFAAASETREVLRPYIQHEFYAVFHAEVISALNHLGLLAASFDNCFVWGKFEVKLFEKERAMKSVFHLTGEPCVRDQFVIDGHTRPAFRVGWAYAHHGMHWIEVKPSQLGLPVTQGDKPMPVFIQSHALIRLVERLGLHKGSMHFSIYESLIFLKYHRDNGRIFIDYNYMSKKIGYLVCSVENKRLLIHTFLFLTNNGTPEGKKLFELTGMHAMDKKYLAIDQLNTLLNYQIEDNEFVKNIFIEAGCGQLLEMDAIRQLLSKKGETMSADIISNYLRNNLPKAGKKILNADNDSLIKKGAQALILNNSKLNTPV